MAAAEGRSQGGSEECIGGRGSANLALQGRLPRLLWCAAGSGEPEARRNAEPLIACCSMEQADGPPRAGEDIIDAALRVLRQPDPHKKAEYTNIACQLWRSGQLTCAQPGAQRRAVPDRPARDDEKVRRAAPKAAPPQQRSGETGGASWLKRGLPPLAGGRPPGHRPPPACRAAATSTRVCRLRPDPCLLPLFSLLPPGQATVPQGHAQARQGRQPGVTSGASVGGWGAAADGRLEQLPCRSRSAPTCKGPAYW